MYTQKLEPSEEPLSARNISSKKSKQRKSYSYNPRQRAEEMSSAYTSLGPVLQPPTNSNTNIYASNTRNIFGSSEFNYRSKSLEQLNESTAGRTATPYCTQPHPTTLSCHEDAREQTQTRTTRAFRTNHPHHQKNAAEI